MATLVNQECVLLADDMGLGKTIQAIAAIRVLFACRQLRKCLIVAPASLLRQWREELYRWARELSVMTVLGSASERQKLWVASKQVFLASYGVLRSDFGHVKRSRWELVVLDEAQSIKNRDSQTSELCKLIPRRRSWALTGTPLENREDELASVLEFVQPNPDGAHLGAFHPGFRLRAAHQDLQLRRRKQDVLEDLPPKQTIRVALELAPEQAASYREMEAASRQGLEELGSRAQVIHVLEWIMRLKQICNFCPRSGRSSKLHDLSSRLDCLSAAGHKALVFSQWTDPRFGVARLAAALKPMHPLIYTGVMTQDSRNAAVELFRSQSQHRVLILSLRAGGLGLNLQQASYVFHFDRWWNPAVENQATDRAHRMGQRHAVSVYCYTCLGTIEERIETILAQKQALFSLLVDGVTLDPRRFLTAQELFGLFGLSAPPSRPVDRTAARSSLTERAGRVLQGSGWNVTRDGARALRAVRADELGLEERILVVDCSREQGRLPEVSEGERLILLIPDGMDAAEKEELKRGGDCWDEATLVRMERVLADGRTE